MNKQQQTVSFIFLFKQEILQVSGCPDYARLFMSFACDNKKNPANMLQSRKRHRSVDTCKKGNNAVPLY